MEEGAQSQPLASTCSGTGKILTPHINMNNKEIETVSNGMKTPSSTEQCTNWNSDDETGLWGQN